MSNCQGKEEPKGAVLWSVVNARTAARAVRGLQAVRPPRTECAFPAPL